MIKTSYRFKTVGPLHTGSDVNAGTLRTLRRQACIVDNPIELETSFDDQERRNAVSAIVYAVWKSISTDQKKRAGMRVWDEFYNKLVAAGRAQNKYQFFEILCRSWGVQSIKMAEGEKEEAKNALVALELISDHELLETVRKEPLYVCLKVRMLRDTDSYAKTGATNQMKLFDAETAQETRKQEGTVKKIITRDEIPCISGNSIRGKWRRLAMYDFCRRVGFSDQSIDKRVYHTFFTGGFLDQSTQNEDIEKMERFVKMNPMLGLFGAAIGNMTIEGEMKVGWAYPVCVERGTGDESYWNYLDTVFQTRHDSSKTEKELDIKKTQVVEGKDEGAHQMKYEYEVFSDGTPFEHRVACTTNNSLLLSAFAHVIEVFKESPFLGGMGSVGNGELSIDGLKTTETPDEYTQYIDEHKTEIMEFWKNATI